MNYTQNLEQEDAFKEQIKQSMNRSVYSAMDDIKKELANEFITPQEEDLDANN